MKERIGEYLIRLELLSFEQAEEILRVQSEMKSGKKFGEIALDLGYVTEVDLEELADGQGESP